MTKTEGRKAAWMACLVEYQSAPLRRRWQIARSAFRARWGLPSFIEREFGARLRA